MNPSPPQICVQPDLPSLCRAAAEATAKLSAATAEQRGGFVIALCGGKTAPHMYRVLAEEYRDSVPWGAWHVFWSDERYVSPESEQSNYGVTRRALLDHVPIPKEQIHPMPTLLSSPEETAVAYEEELTRYFSGRLPRFDLMIMGLGAEGHTASLFPHSPAFAEELQSRLVVAVEVPADPPSRLTLTLPVFNHAENLFFLVSGAEKHTALHRATTGPPDAAECPASAIRPTDGTVQWWVDEAAFTG
jgi:6-phosphogluconolactonase